MGAYAAVDLGAESGRVIRGELRDGRLAVEETARFPTGARRIDGHLRWDLPGFLREIEAGIRAAAALGPLDGVGVDTWGVDFGLLDAGRHLLELPISYRDGRTVGVAERYFETVPAAEVYARTGIQVLPFNTLFQLAGTALPTPARHLLLMPDLIHHHLSGGLATEWTNATTTQCVNATTRTWDRKLLEAAGANPSLFGDPVEPGTVLGPLRLDGLEDVPVIVPATHDTASAVVATPGEGEDWAYLSSGTWSLLGVETDAPVITETARERNFTNEGGVDGTVRLLKNIEGLWLIQCLRRDRGWDLGYDELTALAEAAPPDGPGAEVRGVLESLADRYREVLDELREVSGRDPAAIHVVGGGSKNRLLNQLTADATGLPVLAGPAEATAIGNVMVQARARGEVGSLGEIREVVRRSFPPERFEPHP